MFNTSFFLMTNYIIDNLFYSFFNAAGYLIEPVVVIDVTQDNFSIEETNIIPDFFSGKAMAFDKDTWSVINKEKYDRDFKAYKKSLVPLEVQMWQARAILEQAWYKPKIDAALASDVVARNKWEYATVVKRTDDIVVGMSPLLSLTELQIDDLFIAASKL
jgi:hypothetical protein